MRDDDTTIKGSGAFQLHGTETGRFRSSPQPGQGKEHLTGNDTMMTSMIKLSEGNPSAATALAEMSKVRGPEMLLVLLNADDMNLRGAMLWVAYKEYCKYDANKLALLINHRDPDMVNFLNLQAQSKVGPDSVCTGGASSV